VGGSTGKEKKGGGLLRGVKTGEGLASRPLRGGGKKRSFRKKRSPRSLIPGPPSKEEVLYPKGRKGREKIPKEAGIWKRRKGLPLPPKEISSFGEDRYN